MPKRNKRLLILKVVPNNEKAIDNYCKNYGMVNLGETIYLYLNNTIEETAGILEIDRTTVIRRVNKFLEITRVK